MLVSKTTEASAGGRKVPGRTTATVLGERDVMRRIMLIGTSRLHEPGEIAGAEGIFTPEFLHAGYFHSAGQVVDVLRLISGELRLGEEMPRMFFRRDQTPTNRFDPDVFTAEGLEHRRREWAEQLDRADALVVEVCSLKNYVLDGLHLQGNPNYYRDAPYKEVWKEGYYAHYLPDAGVEVVDDTVGRLEGLFGELVRLAAGRPVVLLPHLLSSNETGTVRARLYEALDDASRGTGLRLVDTRPWVDRLGFRILEDGTTDIHHLPIKGCSVVASDLAELAG